MFSLSPFSPEKMGSRGGFGRPAVLRQPAHSPHSLNLVLPHGIPAAFHKKGTHIYTANRYWVDPKFIGSRYCMPMAFTAKSPLA